MHICIHLWKEQQSHQCLFLTEVQHNILILSFEALEITISVTLAFLRLLERHRIIEKSKQLIPSTVSHCSGNYTWYFPPVTNYINHVHHHASIMYLEETAVWIPSAADYCTQRPSRQLCSVQLDHKACWQAKNKDHHPPSRTAHHLQHFLLFCKPIRLTLTWQQWASSLTLTDSTPQKIHRCLCPQHPDETCLINSSGIRVSKPYCSMAASHQSHLVGGGIEGEQ